ncbi:hypothetical protein CONLIGDRAFT_633761 [Coniochaeta ligniaria NRRL 30616]|uniref:DUF7514 domain-containing protein n=1 Tax=Coniochaeta ligniaria NRRL 30616 TaxID=1408157 RepID=A0A1J7JDV2_9PEZI|nr:hypothetical protein CONLIGDRAFT_633761 [Coniochaeta ligniaria NRRL 30616]
MMMATPVLRPNTLQNERDRMTTQSPEQLFIAYNSGNSTRHGQADAVVRRDVSPRSKPEEDSSDEEATDSGSASDSEEETIISDEIQEEKAQQLSPDHKSDVSLSNKLQESNQDDKPSATSVPPALLGEIRKMIQEEFGVLKAIVESEQSKTDPRRSQEDVSEPPPSPRSGLRIDTQPRLSPPGGSPTQSGATLSPASASPRGDGARLARSMSMGAAPVTPERQILVRFSEDGKLAATGRADKPPAAKSVPQLSPIDEKWGQLFDDRGHPTKRLEQVLRGLANYIVEEFMPQKSIVITPEKMVAFYSLHRLENEKNPFTAIFKCRSKGWAVGVEDMYQDLGCEYYLIPKDAKSRPSIAALTPSGFAKWMTANILAYPDPEAKRLNQIVSELPINADGPWDGITERLPKQISRHLFPDKPERKARRLLDDVIHDYVEEFLPELLPPNPKQSPTKRQPPPRIEVVSEKRSSAPSLSTSSPRTEKYTPEPRSRANSASSPQPPHARLGRAYSDDPSRLSIMTSSGKQDAEPRLPPPPLGRSPSSSVRRRSSPVGDPYRRSVGDLARANSPVPGSPAAEGGRERDEEYLQYVPARADYTPKSIAVDRATPRRVAVVQDGGNPGPTWDEYLSGRQTVSAGGGMFGGRGHKASV